MNEQVDNAIKRFRRSDADVTRIKSQLESYREKLSALKEREAELQTQLAERKSEQFLAVTEESISATELIKRLQEHNETSAAAEKELATIQYAIKAVELSPERIALLMEAEEVQRAVQSNYKGAWKAVEDTLWGDAATEALRVLKRCQIASSRSNPGQARSLLDYLRGDGVQNRIAHIDGIRFEEEQVPEVELPTTYHFQSLISSEERGVLVLNQQLLQDEQRAMQEASAQRTERKRNPDPEEEARAKEERQKMHQQIEERNRRSYDHINEVARQQIIEIQEDQQRKREARNYSEPQSQIEGD